METRLQHERHKNDDFPSLNDIANKESSASVKFKKI